ncbi:MAG: YetF domain-containing protein [Verrucomicrobiota bacterium]
MWKLTTPWWELVLRGIIVYLFLMVALRLTGKRQVGQLAPFDLVLLLVLSNAVQNAMNAGDNSLLGGLILASTLIGLNYLLGLITFKNRKLEALVEGKPEVLIHDGKVFPEVLMRQQISDLELKTAVRNGGCERIEDVHLAVLENNGHVSVLAKKDCKPKA